MMPALVLVLAMANAAARIEIDVAHPDARARWEQAAALIGGDAGAEITVWYPLGSARLRAAPPAKGTYGVTVALEVEGATRALVCTVPAAAKWRWDFVSDGPVLRQGPPRDPPPELAGRCTERRG